MRSRDATTMLSLNRLTNPLGFLFANGLLVLLLLSTYLSQQNFSNISRCSSLDTFEVLTPRGFIIYHSCFSYVPGCCAIYKLLHTTWIHIMRSAIYKLSKMIDCAYNIYMYVLPPLKLLHYQEIAAPPNPHTRKVCFLDARSLHTARMRIVCVWGEGGRGSKFMTGAAFYMNGGGGGEGGVPPPPPPPPPPKAILDPPLDLTSPCPPGRCT